MERKNERYHRGNQTCDTRFAFRWFESHGTRRALALFCAFFLALQALIPCKAAFAYYPSEEVIIGDQATTDNFGTVGVGYMVIAYNNLRATLLALGVQPTDSRLTSEVRAKLSNASSGGSFYEYSTTFLTQSQLSGELPPWTFGVRDFIDTWETIAGSGDQYGPYMDVFYSSASRELYNNAKRDLNTILNGGSLGGTSGGESGNYKTFYSNGSYSTSNNYKTLDNVYYSSNVNKPESIMLMPETISLELPDEGQNMTLDDTHWCYLIINGYSNGRTITLVTTTVSESITVEQVTDARGNSYPFRFVNNTGHSITKTMQEYYFTYDSFDGTTFENIVFTRKNTPRDNTVNSGSVVDYLRPVIANQYIPFSSGGTGGTPPSNWPTDPTPTPPTSPTVPDPPASDPVEQPTEPTGGTPPTFPIQTIVTGTTYPVADLQAVLDAMAEHCEHIRDEIYADTSGLYDNLTTFFANQFQVLRNFIGDENNWLFESLENEFQRMMDYLKDLAEWLAEQMNFDISGGDYDDSTVVSWLKRIYLKLGTGGVSTKPVDPVADPVGAWDWLSALIQQILTALAGGAAALTGTLGELFNGIRTKFPFSIPWDVVAIVTLFDAAPVTPSFTIAYSVFGANVRYDIDLHFFDQQAAMIRAVENVLFCAYLLFKTDWLLNVFGGLSNFLGVKAAGVLKG